MTPPQTPTHYELLGGADGVRRLVDRFYDLMETAPEAVNVRALHAASLKASRDKLFLYLSYWTGGPQDYVEQRGHPRLRMRHFPYSIGVKERDQWLACMQQAMRELDLPEDLQMRLRAAFAGTADWMRNQPEA